MDNDLKNRRNTLVPRATHPTPVLRLGRLTGLFERLWHVRSERERGPSKRWTARVSRPEAHTPTLARKAAMNEHDPR